MTILTWNGRPITELTREELIDVISVYASSPAYTTGNIPRAPSPEPLGSPTQASDVSRDKTVKRFKVGKYYEHRNGRVIRIVGATKTPSHGWALIFDEHAAQDLQIISQEVANMANWRETTKEHWLSGFSD